MSWKLGGIILSARWPQSEESLLQELGLSAVQTSRLHIADTLELALSTTSVAVSENSTLILNRLLPYDLSFTPPFSASLDLQLKQLSKIAAVLSFFMDGMSSTYGVVVFEAGSVVRARKVVSGRVVLDFGKPYAEETGLENEADEETRIFALTKRWMETSLDDLFFNPSFYLNVYET